MITNKQVLEAIKAQIAAVVDPNEARIITRWKLSVDPEEWGAVLRSKKDNNKIHGWMITRTGVRSTPQLAVGHHYEYAYTYALWYFKSVKEGTEAENSEIDFNEVLDDLLRRLHDNPTLGLDPQSGPDVVDAHDGLQIRDIDTVNGSIHVAQCELTVRITYQT